MDDPRTKLLLRVPEAAERLSVSRSRMYAMLANGELPADVVVKLGDSIRVNARKLEEFVERQAIPA